MDTLLIQDLQCRCIIGDESWERETVQEIRVDLEIELSTQRAGESDRLQDTVDYGAVAKQVIQWVQASRFHLIEALAEGIAQTCLTQFPLQRITVHVTKPSHVPDVRAFGMRITRTSPLRGC